MNNWVIKNEVPSRDIIREKKSSDTIEKYYIQKIINNLSYIYITKIIVLIIN